MHVCNFFQDDILAITLDLAWLLCFALDTITNQSCNVLPREQFSQIKNGRKCSRELQCPASLESCDLVLKYHVILMYIGWDTSTNTHLLLYIFYVSHITHYATTPHPCLWSIALARSSLLRREKRREKKFRQSVETQSSISPHQPHCSQSSHSPHQ